MSISVSRVCQILHQAGYTRKVAEGRAIQIRTREIARFVYELSKVQPIHEHLLFLNEVSFGNRCMLQKRGCFLKGSYPFVKCDFNRNSRVSLLCFLGYEGLIHYLKFVHNTV